MSNLIFQALLGLSWEAIVRALELRERAKGVGDGRIEGQRYTVIRRGDEVLVLLPDYQPREKCQEAAKKIFSRLAPESEVRVAEMGRASSHCNYCLEPAPLPYRCHRCGGWYCEGHRLPEQHNCPGGEGRAETAAEPTRARKEERKRRRGEVVVAEVPCG